MIEAPYAAPNYSSDQYFSIDLSDQYHLIDPRKLQPPPETSHHVPRLSPHRNRNCAPTSQINRRPRAINQPSHLATTTFLEFKYATHQLRRHVQSRLDCPPCGRCPSHFSHRRRCHSLRRHRPRRRTLRRAGLGTRLPQQQSGSRNLADYSRCRPYQHAHVALRPSALQGPSADPVQRPAPRRRHYSLHARRAPPDNAPPPDRPSQTASTSIAGPAPRAAPPPRNRQWTPATPA